ncbi:hypothetical protein QBC34DRAFT_412944 [Podospora aff. communis PSN243]|uniref:Uncharacterized protein n=1 Tax=Podospora aff. communis PSN243 TaxID=3040156 RepID=A0AAV9GDG9_9PEZI|nr:hypothetical protein QBC34DRAFT_412944 [Podospora aff. communis PSN243]
MASSLRGVLVLAALCVLPLATAQHREFYRWTLPEDDADLVRRQTPPPGYHPEFGTCGSGTTCENACGENWLSCQASTDLSLFCYNKVQLNQTCCGNGSGRACDNGYYCAWNTFGGKVWCCRNGQSLEECSREIVSSSSIILISSTTPPPDGSTRTVTRTTTTTEIRGTDGTYTTTTTETVPTDGTHTVTRTETIDGPVVTTTTTVGAATVTTTTTVGDATVTTTTTVGTATSITTVTEAAVTQTVSVTVFTSVPDGVSTITAWSTISVTLTTGCPTSWTKDWTKDYGYPTTKYGGGGGYPGHPGAPTGKYTDNDGEYHGGADTPHTGGPYDPPKLLVTPSNGTTSPSAVVTGAAGRVAVGGMVAWAVGVVVLL